MNRVQKSSFRILFLLNLLCNRELSKNEIIEEFEKKGINIKKTSINNYIEKLKSYGILISTKKIKNVNYYSYSEIRTININQEEIDSSKDIKKLVTAQKNIQLIKPIMRVFYKFALFAKNKDIKKELINFDYYSKINWSLFKKLKYHCENKNIIMLDYMMPDGQNKYLTIHADTIKSSDWSNRLYLSGILQGDNKLSQLPIDKIFMIKKVIKENVRIDLKIKVLTYKISEKTYRQKGLDYNEGLSEIKNHIATIRRPLDDTFFTLQRLLSFCPELYYVSDDKIKNLVKEKLYMLKDVYEQ